MDHQTAPSTGGTPSGTRPRTPARVRLLDAAEDLFSAQGIAATGVDAVLSRAGVAPATLYAHFAGKDHLVAAYLERRHERWRTAWDTALERAGDDPVARLLAVFEAVDDLRGGGDAGRGCAFLGAAVEVVDPDDPSHPWLLADTALLVDRLRSLSAAAGAPDPDALAADLLLLHDGGLAARARRTTAPGSVPVRRVRDVAAVVVAHHLTATPGAAE